MNDMKRINKKKFAAAACALLMTASMLAGCAKETGSSTSSKSESSADSRVTTTTTQPIVTLPTTTKQDINPTPATYESLNADKSEKEKFKESVQAKSKIPVISITTKDEEDIVSREKYISCVVDVFNCDEANEITEASAGVKVRGNSSAYYGDVSQILRNQVPYRIKFDEKTNMLGLNNGAECKSWVLLKSDWDLIRNDIAFRFGRAIMGDSNFCSDGQLVHVYVNEKFVGDYELCEQCQINPNRVNITEPEEGYTGTDIGYYLELDNYAESEEGNHYISMDYEKATVTDINGETRQFVPAEYSIKNDLYSQNQIDFIDKYMNNLFKIVYEACENGKYYKFDENYDLVDSEVATAEEAVSAVMDIDSVRDMYILYEIVHDYDCGEGSFFMCVDFDKNSKCEKLKFTSPWDFNWAYNDSTEKYYAAAFTDQSFVNQNGDRSNPWLIILGKQDWFIDKVKDKWTQMNSEKLLKGCIQTERDYLAEYDTDLRKGEEWGPDSAEDLFYWIENRIYWLNSQWVKK
ncbi:hypothetical protein [Ruminococcus sp.]|uniref:hypothetical protein n=1 Tax=Ruminococcus sp. TaxID=41978 RepID=UPI0025F84A7D|nr:hypothetical protein [Ruminococcus sp.]